MKKWLTVLAGLLITGQAQADGNAQGIAFNCRNCHSANAADTGLPALDRLSVQTLRDTLLNFKYGKKTATIMPRIAKGYSDAELSAVAELLGRH